MHPSRDSQSVEREISLEFGILQWESFSGYPLFSFFFFFFFSNFLVFTANCPCANFSDLKMIHVQNWLGRHNWEIWRQVKIPSVLAILSNSLCFPRQDLLGAIFRFPCAEGTLQNIHIWWLSTVIFYSHSEKRSQLFLSFLQSSCLLLGVGLLGWFLWCLFLFLWLLRGRKQTLLGWSLPTLWLGLGRCYRCACRLGNRSPLRILLVVHRLQYTPRTAGLGLHRFRLGDQFTAKGVIKRRL